MAAHSHRGFAGISLILIAVVMAGAVFLGGGRLFSKDAKDNNSLLLPTFEAVPDVGSDSKLSEKKSLQVGTFPLKLKPTDTPAPTPTPPPPQECTDTLAVDFLIDNSGSMNFGSKMVELKKAMVVFGSNFPEDGIIGIQVYSEPEKIPPLGYKEILPISIYKNVKAQYVGIINSMIPNGGTYSKNAMSFAKQKLDQAKIFYPGRKFNLIFISDGIPESNETNKACPGGQNGPLCTPNPNNRNQCRCFAQDQDPTPIANEIKNSGTRIFTISYVDTSEAKFNDRLQSLMRNVASSPSDYYMAPAETQLINILNEITEKICN